ncbi:MAG TPA: hypothetical protein VGB66_07365 [Longimicrobium sp.]|jgi:hypothetical protein
MANADPIASQPAAAAPTPQARTLEAVHADKRLMVHMIPGLPKDAKGAWEFDFRLFADPNGYRVCSLALLRKGRTLYATYGVFASVGDDEILALSPNDLGANATKKAVVSQNLNGDALVTTVRGELEKTHGGEMGRTVAEYDELDKHVKRKTPNNELIANLKLKHMIGICVYKEAAFTARTRPNMAKEQATVQANVALIQALVKQTGKDLPVRVYSSETNLLEHLPK